MQRGGTAPRAARESRTGAGSGRSVGSAQSLPSLQRSLHGAACMTCPCRYESASGAWMRCAWSSTQSTRATSFSRGSCRVRKRCFLAGSALLLAQWPSAAAGAMLLLAVAQFSNAAHEVPPACSGAAAGSGSAGKVLVNGRPVLKAGTPVSDASAVLITAGRAHCECMLSGTLSAALTSRQHGNLDARRWLP